MTNAGAAGAEAAAANPDPTGQKHTLCGTAGVGEHHEIETYSFPLMNAKLSNYPELANALAMTKVTRCDEARAFMRGYYEYLEAHPGFDAESRSK